MSTASTTTRRGGLGKPGQPREQAGGRAAPDGVLAHEGHRPAGDHLLADHHHLRHLRQGAEHVLEQGGPADLHRGLVGALEAGGAATAEHDAAQLGRLPVAHGSQSGTRAGTVG